jgi:hypothetical protein
MDEHDHRISRYRSVGLVNFSIQTVMKNTAGKIGGFVLGTAGFLLMFKIFALPHIPTEDELAPGVVVIAAVLNGFLFAYLGALIQNHMAKR